MHFCLRFLYMLAGGKRTVRPSWRFKECHPKGRCLVVGTKRGSTQTMARKGTNTGALRAVLKWFTADTYSDSRSLKAFDDIILWCLILFPFQEGSHNAWMCSENCSARSHSPWSMTVDLLRKTVRFLVFFTSLRGWYFLLRFLFFKSKPERSLCFSCPKTSRQVEIQEHIATVTAGGCLLKPYAVHWQLTVNSSTAIWWTELLSNPPLF